MKKMLTILLMATACHTEEVKQEKKTSDDYIVFGHYYGECFGKGCVEFYKLTDSKIYEDTKDEYPSGGKEYNGNFVVLDDSVFEKVKNLRDSIPADLLRSINTTVIGTPDAGDWGGIYFEMNHAGESRYWFIDKMISNIPQDLRPFVRVIENKIAEINN